MFYGFHGHTWYLHFFAEIFNFSRIIHGYSRIPLVFSGFQRGITAVFAVLLTWTFPDLRGYSRVHGCTDACGFLRLVLHKEMITVHAGT